MEYIKIKHVHVPANMTDAELGKVVKFQLEIARLERAMTESEKCAFFGRKESQKSWENVTKKHQICEDFVTKKVLEDCEKVTKLRQRNKGNKANSRLNEKTVTGDTSNVVTEQIREDKIREENINNNTPIAPSGAVVDELNELDVKKILDEFCRESVRKARGTKFEIKNPVGFKHSQWKKYEESKHETLQIWLETVEPARERELEKKSQAMAAEAAFHQDNIDVDLIRKAEEKFGTGSMTNAN